MSEIIYVVMGSTGEYSNRNEWSVIAYKEEALASKHVELANNLAREWHTKRQEQQKVEKYKFDHCKFNDQMEEAFKYLDPNISMYYSGTFYWYNEVPVLEAVPGVENESNSST